jgi:LuxR family transcriptional regulator, maltose regulon positive regulatory protein
LEAFSGTHRYVLDYLSTEVLERQPDQVRRFLLQTSVLERLSGPLCDAVTGGADGQGMLEKLERANLFLVPLDQQRRWWRLHQTGAATRVLLQHAVRLGVGPAGALPGPDMGRPTAQLIDGPGARHSPAGAPGQEGS